MSDIYTTKIIKKLWTSKPMSKILTKKNDKHHSIWIRIDVLLVFFTFRQYLLLISLYFFTMKNSNLENERKTNQKIQFSVEWLLFLCLNWKMWLRETEIKYFYLSVAHDIINNKILKTLTNKNKNKLPDKDFFYLPLNIWSNFGWNSNFRRRKDLLNWCGLTRSAV